MGVCFLLTHIVAPITTVIAAMMAVRTRRAELCSRWALKIACWLAVPWLATALVLAVAGFDPVDAFLHFDGLAGPVPMVSLFGAAAVAIGAAVRWRRGADLDARPE
jgi:hypothetical protein